MTATATVGEWVDPAAPVVVAGAELAGLYVGATGPPEVVDPDLAIDVTAPDWHGQSATRPPHYGELTPEARAAFLVWHRTGRRAPQAPPIWALLHLYGLERRMLVEGDDGPDLRAEAKALGEVYGSDPEVARVAAALAGEHPRSEPSELVEGPAPDELQIELGRRALASEPVDAAWALAWAWYHPEIPHREAARQVPDEFARLWRLRFDERFADGLVVSPKRRRLALEYAPANPSLPTPLELTVPDASDVFLTPGPAEVLREITDAVESELATFARWRTRFPDEPDGSIRAAAVLPPALLAGSDAEGAAQPVVEFAESALAREPAAVIESRRLLDTWASATGDEAVERRDTVEIAQVLERFGYGIEPDVRFGGRPLTGRSPAVLFRQVETPTTSPSEAYAAALVTLELCAAVASADGVVDDTERAMLIERVGRVEGVTASERARLDAHRLLVTSSDLRLDDVAARMVGLPLVERHSLATHLLDIARADGVVTDDEVGVLRAVHELLDLDPAEVDRRLRPRTVPLTPRSEPVESSARTESPLEVAPDEAVVPDDEPATERLVQVDEAALRERQADNQAVQDLLGAIFADDEDDEEPEAPAAEHDVDRIGSLDSGHSALLHELVQRDHTGRRDLERAASRHGVLPDGALDVINEAALDLVDDPVIEIQDDGSVTVDHDVYEEMRA